MSTITVDMSFYKGDIKFILQDLKEKIGKSLKNNPNQDNNDHEFGEALVDDFIDNKSDNELENEVDDALEIDEDKIEELKINVSQLNEASDLALKNLARYIKQNNLKSILLMTQA